MNKPIKPYFQLDPLSHRLSWPGQENAFKNLPAPGSLEISLFDDIINEIVEIFSAPPELAESAILAAMSIACQHLVDVECPWGGRSPTSLFLLSSADSGERKSAIESFILEPIFDLDHENRLMADKENQLFDLNMMVWKTRLHQVRRECLRDSLPEHEIKNRLSDLEKSKPIMCAKPRFIYRDESLLNLQTGMTTNWPSAALVGSESTNLFSSQHAKSLPTLSAIWDGRPIDVGRSKMRSLYVPSPRLTISLMLQPLVIRGYLGKHTGIARISGLLSRFVVAEPLTTQGSRYIHPAEIGTLKPYKATKIFHSRLLQLAKYSMQRSPDQRIPMKYSLPAKRIWVDLYNEVESELGPGGDLYDIKDCASKIANNMSRIAALTHYTLGRPGDIDVKTALYARSLSIRRLINFKKIFGIRSPEEKVHANAIRLNTFLANKVTMLMNGNFAGMAKSLQGNIYFEKSVLENAGPLRPTAVLDEALGQLSVMGVVAFDTLNRKKVIRFNPLASEQLPRHDAASRYF